MKKVLVWIVLMSGFAAGSMSPARAEDAALEANAALKYWLAFSVLPQFEHDDQNALGGRPGGEYPPNYLTAPLDDVVQRLIKRSEASLKMMHQGAKLKQCAWGVNYEDGPHALLPHLAKSKQLAGLACLRARFHFGRGDYDAGAQDALATLILARHVGGEVSIVGMLVQEVIERMAVAVLARHLPDFDGNTLNKLIAAVESLPPGASPGKAVLGEKESMLRWFVKRVKSIDPNGPWKEEAEKLFRAAMGGDWRIKFGNVALQGPHELVKQLEALSSYYDRHADMMRLPAEQFQRDFHQLTEEAKMSPFADVFSLTGGYRILYETAARQRVRTAMLRAAIGVVRNGEQGLKDIKDPFSGEPFHYRRLDSGFQLTSKMAAKGLNKEGLPYAMKFGIPVQRDTWGSNE